MNSKLTDEEWKLHQALWEGIRKGTRDNYIKEDRRKIVSRMVSLPPHKGKCL